MLSDVICDSFSFFVFHFIISLPGITAVLHSKTLSEEDTILVASLVVIAFYC